MFETEEKTMLQPPMIIEMIHSRGLLLKKNYINADEKK